MMRSDRYLVQLPLEEGRYEVVVEDLGELRKEEGKCRVFVVEPGNDSCGSFYSVLEVDSVGLYRVRADGEIVRYALVGELPEEKVWGDPLDWADRMSAKRAIAPPNKFICVACRAQAETEEQVAHDPECPTRRPDRERLISSDAI